jgi:hypothetical protein
MDLPYDIDNPPAEPPSGVDQLMWTVAYALRAEHEAGPHGWCVAGTCRDQAALWPCERRRLADAGLMGSIGDGVQRPFNRRRQTGKGRDHYRNER